MTASDSWEKPVVRIALLLCVLSFLVMVYAGWDYKNNHVDEVIVKGAEEDANKISGNALGLISNELNNISNLAEGIAKELRSGELKNDSMIEKRIRDEMENNHDIFSIVVAYSPAYKVSPYKGSLHSLHFKRTNSGVVNATINYDYTNENDSKNSTEWYTKAFNERRAVWNSPYFGTAAGTSLIDYSVPFYIAEFKDGKEAAGVVCAGYSLEKVREQVGRLHLSNNTDNTDYCFIISEKGTIISYPVQEYLLGNISELAKEDTIKNESNLKIINENMEEGIHKNVTNPRTAQSYVLVNKNNISSTNWTLGIVLPQKEILLNKKIEQNRAVIRVVLAAFAFIFFLFMLSVFLFRYEDKSLWLLVLIFSFLCILGMGFIWHLALNESSIEDKNGDILVFDMADVETVLLNHKINLNSPRIPTGIFVQSLEFSNANEVTINGYVWQNISLLVYNKSFPGINSQESHEPTIEKVNVDENLTANNATMTGNVSQNNSELVVAKASSDNISLGSKEAIIKLVAEKTSPSFSFPESKETTIEKAYVDADKGIIGWYFKTTLRQQFNYSRYPFDEEDVWIKFWNNASEGSVLVPDFNSYDNLTPETLPGLESSLVLEAWEPQKTFFSYRVNSYNTNFGVKDFNHTNVSELYFNIDVKRDLKSPFVSDLLPIMVVAALLFVVLVITTKEEKKNQFGFNSSGVLAYCASLFFVLIISHSSLRAKIPTDSIIYLEYFYLIMYLAILAVSLNSIAFASHMNIPFIDAKDNLYVKVLYWPVITGFLLLITLMNFY